MTTYTENAIAVDGQPIEQLIAERTFSGNLLSMLGGKPEHEPTLNAILVAWCDHGEAPPSTQAAIYAASCGVPFSQALTAAIACFGVHHCPIVRSGQFLEQLTGKTAIGQASMVAEALARGEKIPGFGHPIHDHDPRIPAILAVAEKQGVPGIHCQALRYVEHALAKHRKPVKANLAGVSAAVGLDMGLNCGILDLIPILGRSVGLAAHALRQGKKPPLKLG